MRAPMTAAALLLLALAAATAGAGEVALTRDGALVRVDLGEDGLVLTSRLADGSSAQSLVPQTADATVSAIQLAIDDTTDTPYLVWQQGEPGATRILLASYHDGTWLGPTTIGGDDATIASNPEMLIHRTTTTVTETTETEDGDEEETSYTVTSSFIHVVWWSQIDAEDIGNARYAAIPLDDTGTPEVEVLSRFELVDLQPYGIGCTDITEAHHLNFPKLFRDPATGAVNVLAADFSNCLFQVVEIGYELGDEWDDMEKRGRHGVIFGRTTMIAINPDLPLGDAEMKVGRDLTLVVYWDADQAVEYTRVDEAGWTDVQALPFGGDTGLDHEQAVQLIQALAN